MLVVYIERKVWAVTIHHLLLPLINYIWYGKLHLTTFWYWNSNLRIDMWAVFSKRSRSKTTSRPFSHFQHFQRPLPKTPPQPLSALQLYKKIYFHFFVTKIIELLCKPHYLPYFERVTWRMLWPRASRGFWTISKYWATRYISKLWSYTRQ